MTAGACCEDADTRRISQPVALPVSSAIVMPLRLEALQFAELLMHTHTQNARVSYLRTLQPDPHQK
jgi:hypothetical protein